MSLLADEDIAFYVEKGELGITPWDPDALNVGTALQPASVDVRLDRYFLALRPSTEPIDPAVDNSHRFDAIEVQDGDRLRLDPGECVLGSTFEHLAIPPQMIAHLHGKSSLGRLFLLIHCTAGLLDAGWRGYVTLELKNLTGCPMYLYPGQKIGQLTFEIMCSKAIRPYGHAGLGSHYQDQPRGPVPPQGWRNFTHGLPPDSELGVA